MPAIPRRFFLKTLAAGSCALAVVRRLPAQTSASSSPASMPASMPTSASAASEQSFIRPAAFWAAANAQSEAPRCLLCPRQCLIPEGERGVCGVRETRQGAVHTLVYGRACKATLNPIEDHALWHYYPNEKTLTLAAAGCNLNCRNCNRWAISQSPPELCETISALPEEALATCKAADSSILAFDETEPLVAHEYLADLLPLARAANLRTVLSTNGYIQPEPLRKLLPHLSAVKVDLKGFDAGFYRSFCDGTLAPVLETLKLIKQSNVWLEIAYLLVPGRNDYPQWTTGAAKWILENLGPDVPLHFLRHTPDYRLSESQTPGERTMNLHWKLALREGLRYVYVHGIAGHEALRTYCPGCLMPVASRINGKTDTVIRDGKCPFCGGLIAGFWSPPTVQTGEKQENVV